MFSKNLGHVLLTKAQPHCPLSESCWMSGPEVKLVSLCLWWTLLWDPILFPIDSVYSAHETVGRATANHIQAHQMKPFCYPWPSTENSIPLTLCSLNAASITCQFHAIVDGIAHCLQLDAEFSITLPSRNSLLLFCMFTCPFTVTPQKTTFFPSKVSSLSTKIL